MTLFLIIAAVIIAVVLGIGIRYRMLGQMIVMLLALAMLAGVIGYFKYQGFQQFMAFKEGMSHVKQTVSTTTATLEDWRPKLEAVGSLRAAKGVDISNELAGMVDTISFNSGGDVKAGTLLITLRAGDDIAKLHSLEATAKLAEINYQRDKKQFKVQAVSKATLDNDVATLASDKAQVEEQKAIVDKKFIRAPFSGHLGIRNIDQGQYLNPGTAIVTLQELDPIYLDFTLPQQALSQIKVGQKITVKSDTYPDKVFAGKILAINPKVDTATRNVQVRTTLRNPEHALLPGMYATADISVGTTQQFVTLPQTTITYNPYGNTVFLVHHKQDTAKKDGDKDAKNAPASLPKGDKSDDDLVVEQVFVTTGETRGDQVQILKGVDAGEVVVGSGQLKLQNGSAITVDNSVVPKNDPAPAPKDH